MDAPDLLAQEKRRLDDRRRWRGLDISIENRAGSTRHWTDGNVTGFSVMWVDYGYIRLTEDADGEHLDVFLAPEPEASSADVVWVVDQLRRPDFQRFDEHKVLIGYNDREVAAQTYRSHYNDPRFLGEMHGYDAAAFAAFVTEHRRCPEVGELENVEVRKSVRGADDDDDIPAEAIGTAIPREEMGLEPELVTIMMPDGTVLRSTHEVEVYVQTQEALAAGYRL